MKVRVVRKDENNNEAIAIHPIMEIVHVHSQAGTVQLFGGQKQTDGEYEFNFYARIVDLKLPYENHGPHMIWEVFVEMGQYDNGRTIWTPETWEVKFL